MRTGIANLPLHGGKAPRWLFERMTRLAREIVCHLVAELVYGARAASRDPAAYAFAHGGKDGTPYPVAREHCDRTIDAFHVALSRARLGDTERREALKRLGQWAQRLAEPPLRPAARD